LIVPKTGNCETENGRDDVAQNWQYVFKWEKSNVDKKVAASALMFNDFGASLKQPPKSKIFV
jgi:hypothetical protein